jgi:hypothetical protein
MSHEQQVVQVSGVAVGLKIAPTLIEHGDFRFLILDTPTDEMCPVYLQVFQKYSVDVIVRACDPTYDTKTINAAGIDIVVPYAG